MLAEGRWLGQGARYRMRMMLSVQLGALLQRPSLAPSFPFN